MYKWNYLILYTCIKWNKKKWYQTDSFASWYANFDDIAIDVVLSIFDEIYFTDDICSINACSWPIEVFSKLILFCMDDQGSLIPVRKAAFVWTDVATFK